ncbi:DUF2934 domain-containing protein [Paracraurococcus ruber]|uniref:DUF2934 domain-containing protein n=1 Tax=Paracraurococcus ruber TaxID=77675 RepID=A0ABS1D1I5_9PROT|nr:DUF2934 domain-containing protein [Paracraurococcus ruber]MBK1660157.1 hypothetical protein [Paracraurococcus ruber]TDG26939.1 DUF2934 domain-containing protein [Paracraurococcus ruber]
MSDTDREQRIRIRAYHLWEAEGRPGDRAEAHWEEACRQDAAVDEESAGSFPASDSPSSTPVTGAGRA